MGINPPSAASLRTVALVLAVLAYRRRLRQRDHWSRPKLLAHQRRALARLRAHAYQRSSFYRDFDWAGSTAGLTHRRGQTRGPRLFEDLVITEVLDTSNQPVPLGEFGANVLVTVLFSRTLPLIRNERSTTTSFDSWS